MSSSGMAHRSDDWVRRVSDLQWLHAASTRFTEGTPHVDIPVAVSESAAIATTFLRLLHLTPLDVVFDRPPRERLAAQLQELLLMLADEPKLADMCLRSMLVPERAVAKTRRHIGNEVDRRIRAALGTGAWPEVVNLFEFALYGAVLEASFGPTTPDEVADRLSDLVDIVFSSSA